MDALLLNLIAEACRVVLSATFVASGWSKWRHREEFVVAVAGYGIETETAQRAIVMALPPIEVAVAAM